MTADTTNQVHRKPPALPWFGIPAACHLVDHACDTVNGRCTCTCHKEHA